MARLIHALLVLAGLACAPAPAAAQLSTLEDYRLIEAGMVRVCQVSDPAALPDFSAPECRTQDFWTVDPQGRHIWMQARLDVDLSRFAETEPLGLLVSGKASSAAWINGVSVGSNGAPAEDAASEIPGRMDAVLYVPRSLVRQGENTVVLRLSSWNGLLRLSSPMHAVALGPYRVPHQQIILAYWPALITFGVFLLGLVYFGATALRGEGRAGSAILSLASLFAGAQLLTEALRGIIAYPYPVHDLRLILILVFAGAFGLCIFAWLVLRLTDWGVRARAAAVSGLAALMALTAVFSRGFDAKTVLVLVCAIAAGLAVAAFGVWRRRPGSIPVMGLLAGLAALILWSGPGFLDRDFYFAAAALLLYLFYRQAAAIVDERRRRRREEARAHHLELALEQARQRAEPARLQLVSSGRTEFVAADRIVRLSGAGDYVEVHFAEGACGLYDGGLTALEEALPPSFIRVHRSHIVNAAFVRTLERDSGGTGRLVLSDGSEAPVSRRVMPKVRSVLSGDADGDGRRSTPRSGKTFINQRG